MVIALRDNAEHVGVTFEGRTLSLDRVDAHMDAEVFSNSVYTLYVEEDEAALEREGTPVYSSCYLSKQ